jgi:hypothetical protein
VTPGSNVRWTGNGALPRDLFTKGVSHGLRGLVRRDRLDGAFLSVRRHE